MARISELEQRGSDTLEIAISQSEYDDLIAPTDPLELRITILDNNGNEIGNFLLSTDQADWTLDAGTGEYLLVEPVVGFGNHRTNWDGLVLSSTNSVGLDTVEDGLMIGPFGLAVDADGALATTVGTATNIPTGTALTLIDQSTVTGSGTGATLRFDAPDVDTPIVSFEDGLGDTGTSPPVCFAAKTQIACATGSKAVEDLVVGDLVVTQGHGLQPILWIGEIKISAQELAKDKRLRPVRIAASALGNDLPERDLLVTRQHRIVATSEHVQDLTGTPAVLIAAHRLTELPRVSLVQPKHGISYFHILFANHEIVFANGLPSESLYMGNQARSILSASEIIAIENAGVDLGERQTAVPVPDHRVQKQIVATHLADASSIHAADLSVRKDALSGVA